MQEDKPFIPIVQHKSSQTHYEYIGNDTFRNVVTGKEGLVEPDKASKAFDFCMDLSNCINDYPEVLGLLKIGFKQTK